MFAWEAALLSAGTCSFHASWSIFGVAVHSFKVNPPRTLKPPHNGTFLPNCAPYFSHQNCNLKKYVTFIRKVEQVS